MNTRRWPNAVLMLAQRLWRWCNIKPALGQRFVLFETAQGGSRHLAWIFSDFSQMQTAFLAKYILPDYFGNGTGPAKPEKKQQPINIGLMA